MNKKVLMAIVTGTVLTCSQPITGQEAGPSPAESITEAEMRDHIFFLASDYLGGRVAASAEYEIAAHYVAAQFASGGVEELSSENGNINGYFQEVPSEKIEFEEEASWVLNLKKGTREFIHREDYKILEGRFVPEEALEVVFAGYGIKEPDHGWNDFEDIDIEGKMVMVMAGAPLKKGEAVLPDFLD